MKEMIDESSRKLKHHKPEDINHIELVPNQHNKAKLIEDEFTFFKIPILKNHKDVTFSKIFEADRIDFYLLTNDTRSHLLIYISAYTPTPNFDEYEEIYEGEAKIKYNFKKETTLTTLYLGVSCRNTIPISIKPIYGEIRIPKSERRIAAAALAPKVDPKLSKKDVFKANMERLFFKMSDEERKEEIRQLIQDRHQKAIALSQGKNYLDINKVLAASLRKTGIFRLYKQNSMKYEEQYEKVVLSKQEQIEESHVNREFLLKQSDLRKVMKKALIKALQEREAVASFVKSWITMIYYLDIVSSLREHVAERRARRNDIERVLGTMAAYVENNKRMMCSKGNDINERCLVHFSV